MHWLCVLIVTVTLIYSCVCIIVALCSVKLPFQLDMESAINILVAQFKTFAAKDGSSHTLSKEEFQTLVASQLPNLVKVRINSSFSTNHLFHKFQYITGSA